MKAEAGTGAVADTLREEDDEIVIDKKVKVKAEELFHVLANTLAEVNVGTLERLRFTFTPNGKRQIQVEKFSE